MSPTRKALAVLAAAGLAAAGLAGCARPASPPPSAAATAPVPEVSTTVHVRSVGPAEAGHDITVRYGDLVRVTPGRGGGWRLVGYPAAILRPQDTTGPAAGHTLLAVAVGEGEVVLADGADRFAVHVRVLRDLVQPPPA